MDYFLRIKVDQDAKSVEDGLEQEGITLKGIDEEDCRRLYDAIKETGLLANKVVTAEVLETDHASPINVRIPCVLKPIETSVSIAEKEVYLAHKKEPVVIKK